MIEGKGLWIWKADQLLKVYSSIQVAIEEAHKAGFSAIYPKIANGYYAYLPGTPEGKLLPQLFATARQFNMKIYPWMYTYAHTITGETRSCVDAFREYGGDGFIYDAEGQYKKSGTDKYAKDLVGGFKFAFPTTPVGYTSYRFPETHSRFPFAAFTEVCDFTCPQVYWLQTHNPGQQLAESKRQYDKFSDLPFIPLGSSYRSAFWKPTVADVDEFSEIAHNLGLSGISWWRWDTAVELGLWNAIAQHEWPISGQLTDKEKLDLLWSAHPELHPEGQ